MTVPEKLRMAAKLVELGVDILEAGFPIASEGDSEAVDAISREFPWANVAALARANRAGRGSGGQGSEARTPPAHPLVYRDQRHSSEIQAQEIARAGARRSMRGGDAGAVLRR